MTTSTIPQPLTRAVKLLGWLAAVTGLLAALATLPLTLSSIRAQLLLGESYWLLRLPLWLTMLAFCLFVVWVGTALQRLRHWSPETSAIWPFLGAFLLCMPLLNIVAGWLNFQSLLNAGQQGSTHNARRWRLVVNAWTAFFAVPMLVTILAQILDAEHKGMSILTIFAPYMRWSMISATLLGSALILKISNTPLRITRDQALANIFA